MIIHARELKRTTNTGRLAHAALVNSELLVRGSFDRDSETPRPIDLTTSLRSEYRPLLFYPGEGAHELTSEFVKVTSENGRWPIQLLVPDGNWRQASKVGSRHPELAHVPRIQISTPNLGKNHLRAEHTTTGLSTLEAVALAMGVLEGEELRARLLALYEIKLRRTLERRGIKTTV